MKFHINSCIPHICYTFGSFCAGKGLFGGFGEAVSGDIVENMRQKEPP
jgi:hypothetical protein